MVIAIHASDSTNTLVSLDNNHDARSKEVSISTSSSSSSSCQGNSCRESYRRTSLLLPVEDLPGLDSSCSSLDDSEDSYGLCCSCDDDDEQPLQEQYLYLPSSSSTANVDDALNQVPAIRASRDELLSSMDYQNHHVFSEASPEQILYVLQGEVAHATASQCEFLVSDRATTCHILALRSSAASSASHDQDAMTTLCHIDGVHYESSVREMVQAHKLHHQDGAIIEMDITILGGFRDEEGQSQTISNWLLNLLADVADEEERAMSGLQMKLKTCVISSMNDNGSACPIGRGLAIHLATGHTFLAKADQAVLGPLMPLRNARLWSPGDTSHLEHKLSLIHSTASNDLIIQPFSFAAIPGMEKLLDLDDDTLLQYTSTSPTVEEDDFCHSIRTSIQFLKVVPCARIFGRNTDQLLRFGRSTNNQWTATC